MIFKTVSEIQENIIHLPFGQPKLKTPVFHLRNVTLLYQEGFALAFDDYLNTPVWISQTFNGTHLTVTIVFKITL
jgi:hypothetical protein